MIQWQSQIFTLADLKDYQENPRTLKKDELNKLIKSIKEDGYHQRVIIDIDGTIIGGHQRKKALLKAGFKESDKIEVLIPDRKLTAEEFDRINIRDNLQIGEFDFDFLANKFEAETLIEWGMPEEWLQFEKEEIEVTEEDNVVPDMPIEPVAKLGDIWQLGEHRLMCGDSTNPTDVSRLTRSGEGPDRYLSPNLMVTDPPYGVNYDPSWREGADLGVGKRSTGKVLNDDKANWAEAYSLFTGQVAYVWHGGLHTHTVAQNLIDCGFDLVAQIIWVKQHFVLSRGDYHWQHEPCWYAVRKGSKHFYNGARDQSTTWEIKNNNSFGNANKEETVGHGTQKPLECMLRPIMNNSSENEYVYDPFGGSGSTLIACEKSKRKCLMMELSPNYCDVIVARWEKLTGKKAELLNA